MTGWINDRKKQAPPCDKGGRMENDMKKPLILMILDGFGIGTNFGNAIREANKPNMEKIFSTNPSPFLIL